MKYTILALVLVACTADQLPTDETHEEVAGAQAQALCSPAKGCVASTALDPAYSTGNTNDGVHIGDDWLKVTADCYAAMFAPEQFTFTTAQPGQSFALTGPSYLINVTYWFTANGLVEAHVFRKRNRTDRAWEAVAVAQTLTSQQRVVLNGRIDFNTTAPQPGQTPPRLAYCNIERDSAGHVFGFMRGVIP